MILFYSLVLIQVNFIIDMSVVFERALCKITNFISIITGIPTPNKWHIKPIVGKNKERKKEKKIVSLQNDQKRCF